MKKFLAIQSPITTKWLNKLKNKFTLYSIIDSNIEYIAEWYVKYGCTKWGESEAMDLLVAKGHIDPKYTGYYHDHEWNMDTDFCITYIIPNNL